MVLTIAAVAVAAVLVHREFARTPVAQRSTQGAVLAFQYVDQWQDLIAKGRLIGRATAPVKIIEFMDLECPACRVFHASLQVIRDKYEGDVAYIFVHMPLTMHRFAVPAARAVECAAAAGRFSAMVEAIYRKQDSLGLKTWVSYARDAQVSDTESFGRCANQSGVVSRAEDGVAAGRSIGLTGTPTIIVNGWRFSRPPSEAELVHAIDELMAGRPLGRPASTGPGQ